MGDKPYFREGLGRCYNCGGWKVVLDERDYEVCASCGVRGDPPPPLPEYAGENAAVVRAMIEVEENPDPNSYSQMISLLLDSMVYVPTDALPFKHEPDGVTPFALYTLFDPGGHKLTPVFTDPEPLKRFYPEAPHFPIQCRGFFGLLTKYCHDIEGVVINPFDPVCGKIRPLRVVLREEFSNL